MGSIKSLKNNNKGAALVLVIIAMSFIGVLAAAILWIAYMNYYIKVTDKRATANFYSAEGIVEQIKIGLEEEVSEASKAVYSGIVSSYAQANDQSLMSKMFCEGVTKELQKRFAAGDTGHYNLQTVFYKAGLSENGVQQSKSSKKSMTATVSLNSVTECVLEIADPTFNRTHIITLTAEPNIMETAADSIVLRNVEVKYRIVSTINNENNYLSIIKTDFRLQVPYMETIHGLTDGADAAEAGFFSYGLIGNRGIVGNGNNVTFNASVYGGKSENSETLSENTVELVRGDNWLFTDAARIITGDNIQIADGASLKVEGGADTELWAGNITLEKEPVPFGVTILDLDCQTSVADDLTVNSHNFDVKLSGTYFGFGYDDYIEAADSSALESSAIIINTKAEDKGKKAADVDKRLDMSGLTKLDLYGRSYVDVEKQKGFSDSTVRTNQKNVPMGESITVQLNQLAYLVPKQALISEKAGVTPEMMSNPMTNVDFIKNRMSYGANMEYVPFPGVSPHNLDYYAEGVNVNIRQGSPGTGYNLIYYYLMLRSDKVDEYFDDYYKANPEAVRNYWERSVDMKELTASGNVVGKYYYYNDSENRGGNAVDTMTEREIRKKKESFLNLNRTLTDYDSGTADNVYDNIVKDIDTGAGTQRFVYTAGGRDYIAYLVNGDVSYPIAGEADNSLVKLIVATGNITISQDFEGCAIAKNRIYINGSINIRNTRPTAVNGGTQADVLCAINGKNSADKRAFEYFKNGNAYRVVLADDDPLPTPDGVSDNEVNKEAQVYYENWQKK